MKTIPIAVIYPEGGEPLYEDPDNGLRYTATDYATSHGFESIEEFRRAINDRRTTATNYD